MHTITGLDNRVTASSETLLRQAPMTAYEYMRAAVRDIDEVFGAGYAKAHPELVGQYMLTCAADFGAAVIARDIGDALDALDAIAQVIADKE
jgi:hypothetical protein